MQRKKRGIGRFLRMKIILVVNLALLGMVVWGFSGEFARNRAMQKEIDTLVEKAKIATAKNLELEVIRERFTGEGQLEREARLKLNLKRPGEHVVIIKGNLPTPAKRTVNESYGEEREATITTEKKNFEKWFNYLLRNDVQ